MIILRRISEIALFLLVVQQMRSQNKTHDIQETFNSIKYNWLGCWFRLLFPFSITFLGDLLLLIFQLQAKLCWGTILYMCTVNIYIYIHRKGRKNEIFRRLLSGFRRNCSLISPRIQMGDPRVMQIRQAISNQMHKRFLYRATTKPGCCL